MSVAPDLDEQRVRLVAACSLERVKLGVAWHDVRRAIAPPSHPGRLRPVVLRTIGYALPLLGYRRMGRTLRILAVGVAIWRAVTAWRGAR
jgi:hypothetical protein